MTTHTMSTQIGVRCDHCGGTITMTLKSGDRGAQVTYRCAGCGCEWEFGFVLVRRGAHCPIHGQVQAGVQGRQAGMGEESEQ
jgi:DNA-directed RNA polymerase subunit RPC12/RpoP